jgi:hypothetical protein
MKIKANKNLQKLSPKRFILDHLIPFIMRDAGRGFAMDMWSAENRIPGYVYEYDGLKRIGPACGTVACIGGSIQCLTGLREHQLSKMAELLGITEIQAYGLFYHYRPHEDGWPTEYAKRLRDATTPYRRAQVTCSLLRKIANEGSAALPKDEDTDETRY